MKPNFNSFLIILFVILVISTEVISKPTPPSSKDDSPNNNNNNLKKYQTHTAGQSPQPKTKLNQTEQDSDFIRNIVKDDLNKYSSILKKIEKDTPIETQEFFIPMPLDELENLNDKSFNLKYQNTKTFNFIKCKCTDGIIKMKIQRGVKNSKNGSKFKKNKGVVEKEFLEFEMDYNKFQSVLLKYLKEDSERNSMQVTYISSIWISKIINQFNDNIPIEDIKTKDPYESIYEDYEHGYDIHTLLMVMGRILKNNYF